jgi:flagellar hook-basal body complex protein FliE
MTAAAVVSPLSAANAYARSQQAPAGAQPSFGDVLQNTLHDAIDTGNEADQQAIRAITGHGDVNEVVAALTHAQLTLQTATVIRDVSEVLRPFFRWRRGCARRYGATASS